MGIDFFNFYQKARLHFVIARYNKSGFFAGEKKFWRLFYGFFVLEKLLHYI